MNSRTLKIGHFLQAVVKLPPDIYFVRNSDDNILFSDPYNDDDIIFYVYIYHVPANEINNIAKERATHGIKISLLENPQIAYDNITNAIKELQGIINVLVR